jgi:hypothetical protein
MLPRVTGARSLALALASAAVLGGCSLGGDEEPEPARGAPKEVAEVVTRLDEALRSLDYETVCNDLFTASARKRAGGDDCVRLMRSTTVDTRAPKVEIAGIVVKGDRASVKVRSSERGQPAIVDELELVRQGDGYRIDALR